MPSPRSWRSRTSLPAPSPTGTVHLSPLSASQSAVRMGALTRYQPFAEVVVHERLQQHRIDVLSPQPATDH